MGNWITQEGWEISVHNMSDAYVANLIGYAARGGGYSPTIVLDFLDELYRSAKERKIIKGLPAAVLKAYTKRLWKRRACLGARETAKKTPGWVEWMIKYYCPHRDF